MSKIVGIDLEIPFSANPLNDLGKPEIAPTLEQPKFSFCCLY